MTLLLQLHQSLEDNCGQPQYPHLPLPKRVCKYISLVDPKPTNSAEWYS